MTIAKCVLYYLLEGSFSAEAPADVQKSVGMLIFEVENERHGIKEG